MLWTFAILGAAGLAASLYGLLVSLREKGRVAPHALALCAVAVAWTAGHQSAIGWAAIVAGVTAALVGLRELTKKPKSVESTESGEPETAAEAPASAELPAEAPEDHAAENPSPVEGEVAELAEALPPSAPEVEIEPPPPVEKPPPVTLQTIVLLRAAWSPATEVLCAAMRRGGERRARVSEASVGGMLPGIEVGPIHLELQSVAAPFDRSQVEDAAGQSWNWPDAAKRVGDQAAHVVFTTTSPAYDSEAGSSRDDILRLHLCVHRALAEFAPVIAGLWPGACRLVPIDATGELEATGDAFERFKGTALNFRTFPFEGSGAGFYCCDTAGLSALGLVDLEVVTSWEPDATLSAAIVDMARRVYLDGADPATLTKLLPQSDCGWTATCAMSSFPPSRSVIRFEPADGSTPPAVSREGPAQPL